MQDNYLRTMKADKDLAKDYYAKSINKTEQQKALESLLADSIAKGELDRNVPYKIADLACGGGTLSYHLSSFFPNASFVLVDYNEDGLELAKEINAETKDRMEFIQGDLRDLPLQDSHFDLVFCWQTLGWVEKESINSVMQEIIRILKPSGRLYASSLFNTEFDVDLYTTICDRTRPSSYNEANPKEPLANGYYNTYCKQSIIDMCDGVQSLEIVPFYPQIDFKRDFSQRGIGSFTLALDSTESNFAFQYKGKDSMDTKIESIRERSDNNDENVKTNTQSNALGAEAEKHFTQTSTTIPSGNIFEIESVFSSKATRSLLGVSAAVNKRRITDSSQKDNTRHNSDEMICGGGGAKHNSHTIKPYHTSSHYFSRNATQLGDSHHYQINRHKGAL